MKREIWNLNINIEILIWLNIEKLFKNKNEKFEKIAWMYEKILMLQ